MAAAKAPHHPRAKKWQSTVTAVSKKEHKQIHKTYRDESGLSNIEKYNLKRQKEARDPGNKKVVKTTREWAEIIQERESERQKRMRAEDSLAVQVDRALGYQKEVGELNRELWWKRTGAFFLGIGIGLFISYLIIHFY